MNRLKELRKSRGLTLKDLADETRISYPVISYLENEKRPFTQEHLEILASFFDCSTDYLLGHSDIKKPRTKVIVELNKDGTITPIQAELIHNVDELTAEEMMKVFEYIDFLKSKKINVPGGNNNEK